MKSSAHVICDVLGEGDYAYFTVTYGSGKQASVEIIGLPRGLSEADAEAETVLLELIEALEAWRASNGKAYL